MSAAGISNRPMRADARRNRARLLAEARRAFAAHGPDVALEEIARLAGVGIGTLYRHFPTRQALLEAVYHEQVAALAEQAHELLTAMPADEAVAAWLAAVAAVAAEQRGLIAAMKASLESRSELFESCHARLRRAAESLLARARQDGLLRPDVTPGDLLGFAYAAAVATEHSPQTGERLLAVLADGLRRASRP